MYRLPSSSNVFVQCHIRHEEVPTSRKEKSPLESRKYTAKTKVKKPPHMIKLTLFFCNIFFRALKYKKQIFKVSSLPISMLHDTDLQLTLWSGPYYRDV